MFVATTNQFPTKRLLWDLLRNSTILNIIQTVLHSLQLIHQVMNGTNETASHNRIDVLQHNELNPLIHRPTHNFPSKWLRNKNPTHRNLPLTGWLKVDQLPQCFNNDFMLDSTFNKAMNEPWMQGKKILTSLGSSWKDNLEQVRKWEEHRWVYITSSKSALQES